MVPNTSKSPKSQRFLGMSRLAALLSILIPLGFGAVVTAQTVLLEDDFESGNLTAWSSIYPPPDGLGTSVVATGAYPALAVDSQGDVHLAYARDGKLWYRKFDAQAETWSNEAWTGIDQLASYRNKPRIDVDSNDRPHVVGGKSYNTGRYAYWNGSKWVVINHNLNRDTDLAVDTKDNVYIVKRGGSFGGFIGARRRAAGANSLNILPDPDIANGLPLGRNDHVYGSVFVNPVDDSVHVVYRHGNPTHFAYRTSADGGQNWAGGGVSNDDNEEPSGTASANGSIYVVSGRGDAYVKTGAPSQWKHLGRAVMAGHRMLPVVSADANDNLYFGSFGGRFNVYESGAWLTDLGAGDSQLFVPSLSGDKLGFLRVAAVPDGGFAYVIWEEGPGVRAANDNADDNFDLVFSTLDLEGRIGN
jgi:hypothetical protein